MFSDIPLPAILPAPGQNNKAEYWKRYIAKNPTALLDAAARGQVDLLRDFISADTNLEFHGNNNTTALHEAVRGRHDLCVQLLVDHGASVNVVDASGKTPLSYARDLSYATIARYLLDNHAGIRPMKSVLKGHKGCVRGAIFSKDGQFILSEAVDGTLRLWDVDTGLTRVTTPKNELEAFWTGTCDADVTAIMSEDIDDESSLRYNQRLVVQGTLTHCTCHFHHARFRFPSPEENLVGLFPMITRVVCQTQRLNVALHTPKRVPDTQNNDDDTNKVHRLGSPISSTPKSCEVGTGNDHLYFMTRDRKGLYPGKFDVMNVSPDRNLLATIPKRLYSNQSLDIWRISNDQHSEFIRQVDLRFSPEGLFEPRNAVFSADSKRVAILSSWDKIMVFEILSCNKTHEFAMRAPFVLHTPQPFLRPTNTAQTNTALAFSPNGRLLASACSDYTIRLFEV